MSNPVIVTVQVTHKGKAGNLDLTLAETKEFYLADDAEAVQFGLSVNADPDCKIIGYKTVVLRSASAATADLASLKSILATAF